jgi:uncharacterized protein (TIGR02147 family)
MMSIFEYVDYRKVLQDLYNREKASNRCFSYRILAELVGYSSAGFFTKILQGAVNISKQKALAFAKAFKLTKIETDYFQFLVAFNQSRTHEERTGYFEKLIEIRKKKLPNSTLNNYEVFSEWYYVVILELLDFYPFSGNYKDLGTMVIPSLSAENTREAVETLEQFGFIIRNKEGYYERVEKLLSSQDYWASVAQTNYHIKTAELAKSAILNSIDDSQDIASYTFAVSDTGYKQIQNRLDEFKKDVADIVRSETENNRVYHLNVHLFSGSKPYNGMAIN